MAIKVRDFEVRLTRNKEERKQVRQLRYQVFCMEEGAGATEEQRALGEEYDAYDRFAEYMAVFHQGRVVGTYRIIDRNAAEKMGGFYTETEFNLSKIKKHQCSPNILTCRAITQHINTTTAPVPSHPLSPPAQTHF